MGDFNLLSGAASVLLFFIMLILFAEAFTRK